jgi:hypothetical protein
MRGRISKDHPLRKLFTEAVYRSLHERLGLHEDEQVDSYLADLLVTFLHDDRIYAIHDASGQRVESVVEMLAEGDVRQRADSFDREREVHKHVGDFLLFWSGVFPEYLKQLKAADSADFLVNPVEQGSYSYYIVSTFDHDPYGEEAPTFKKLSADFEAYMQGLELVRASFEGFALQGWVDGFEA